MVVKARDALRALFMGLRVAYLRRVWGHDLHPTVRISFSAYLDRANPGGIAVGAQTIITRGVVILAHDFTRSINASTRVGRNCLIGVNAIVFPGVTIGDEVVVGAGAVVTRDIPGNSVVAGNPAQVVGR